MPKPPILARLRKAAEALKGEPSPGLDRWAHSTVRPQDTHQYSQRKVQFDHAALLGRFAGTVKIAASRNAMALAGLNVRLYRRRSASAKSYWETKEVPRLRQVALRQGMCGRVAAKSMTRFGDVEEITDPLHPLLRLMQTANPLHNGFDLIELTGIWLGLCGDAPWYVARNGPGDPVELWPLSPQWTRPVPSRETIVEQYVYGAGTECETLFDAADIIPIRNTHPSGNPYHGYGDLEACVREADLNSSFIDFAQTMIHQGAMPGMVVSGTMTPDQREQVEQAIRAKHEGLRNVGRTFVFPAELDVTAMNLSDKEIAFLNSADRMDQIISGCFDMPLAIMRLETAALATAKAAVPQWQLMAIQPRARRIEDVLNQHLVQRIFLGREDLLGDRGAEDLILVFDDAVTRDMEALSTRIVSEYSAGLRTKNEARNELGLDDVEGGDEFKADPLASGDGFGLAGSGGGARGNEEDRPEAPQGRDGERETPRDSGKSLQKPVRADSGTTERDRRASVGGEHVESRSASSLIFQEKAGTCCHRPSRLVRKDDRFGGNVIQATELELESVLRQFFQRVTGEMVPNLSPSGLAYQLTGNEALVRAFNDVTAGPLGKLYLSGWNAGITDMVRAGRGGTLMSALTDDVLKYLGRFQGKARVSIFETVDNQVRNALIPGVEAGDSIDGLTQRLLDTMEKVTTYGAERIARTESARAYLTSREESWQEIGGVKEKRWLLSADPCPICQTMAEKYNRAAVGQPFLAKGATITLLDGSLFTNDYADMDVPPAHPQCRCSMAAVFEE
jgi:HK97 family phage portal protein